MWLRIAARMFDALSGHAPAVVAAVKTWELSTPLSTQHFANAPHGAIYGLAHTPVRFECRELSAAHADSRAVSDRPDGIPCRRTGPPLRTL